ncbi:hypothetical protein ASPWEDRAFT_51230 [Aspergillus wentii DTO 134E9]|uniref:Uncharacterized protein n=1 Tax=Aspergillus wentii DTO 134E9 TaxID=1073089 RepID=A0A1L9RJE5_ASPWE|nr:uncharacterized protein ASPWEDRAFT_51230 [Aspergillus wentii DTO 134E9]KAI9932023.1 hypothetical protein MW887_009526 [Aspergillus wentii]OJJ35021.1 hypothetical protein ASPWEDRAFT_51230 [Aspergillus wentii DTO 134E9]
MALRTSRRLLPWTQSPLIANAPMSGIATSALAVAVTRAGGLGQIGYMDDLDKLSEHLHTARHELQDIMAGLPNPDVLPIGLGVIAFGSPMTAWMELFTEYKPAVAWLSFAATHEFKQWTERIRRSSPQTKVWIQLGSVTAAIDIARECQPDAIVLQGSDAGGHGHRDGASLISLLPEVVDAFQERGLGDIPLVAAGGITDGRGTAAALTLGASGVVMGTRFLAAREADIPSFYREAIFDATDGGEATARSRVFDEIWGPNIWPQTYDGRCLRNAAYEEYRDGVGIQSIRAGLFRAMQSPEKVPVQEMSTIWAGTGVGMINQETTAAEIVQGARKQVKECLERTYTCLER